MAAQILRGFSIISIHTPREGCDHPASLIPFRSIDFNPHTPRGVRLPIKVDAYSVRGIFQSTHPARGATGARRLERRPVFISIHTPREGCDRSASTPISTYGEFQSTHPARGATGYSISTTAMYIFQSTHPARGATGPLSAPQPGCGYFNPRTPRGVRPAPAPKSEDELVFQSTHPARGATRDGRPALMMAGQFQSTHPARGATIQSTQWRPRAGEFQSTHPARGATAADAPTPPPPCISIHAPREGFDARIIREAIPKQYFNPRTPRGVRPSPERMAVIWRNFNPRTPRGVRRAPRPAGNHCTAISIHAPREGCDWGVRCWKPHRQISIHAPREGCDHLVRVARARLVISIHAPREGCDIAPAIVPPANGKFQSTHPARGATSVSLAGTGCTSYFNPRTPRGVRLASAVTRLDAIEFQSTHPARGATARRSSPGGAILPFQSTHPARGATTLEWLKQPAEEISIHAPREGCDIPADARRSSATSYFNPRTPRGVRHGLTVAVSLSPAISIHAPREGCDAGDGGAKMKVPVISIHAPREGCDARYRV